MKLDLLTNATVIDDAIRFVSLDRSKDKVKIEPSSSNSIEDDREESYEPDYEEEDEDHLEEDQEEGTGKIAVTTNQVF